MNKKPRWTLKEIRQGYRENLEAFNELFPLRAEVRRTPEDIEEREEIFHKGEEHFSKTLMKRLKKAFPKVKEAADHSGGAVVWRRGDPLDGLDEGLRERIKKGLEFGV